MQPTPDPTPSPTAPAGQSIRQAPRGPGRPTLLTAEVQARIVSALRGNASQQAAAIFGRIHPGTFYRWMAEAAEHGEASPYFEFREEVMRAEADAEVSLTTNWTRMAASDWRAARDLLRARHRESPAWDSPRDRPVDDDDENGNTNATNALVSSTIELPATGDRIAYLRAIVEIAERYRADPS